MKITISDQAFSWYKDELKLKEGDTFRFLVRYGGISPIQQGFSLGLSNDSPINAAASFEKDGIFFFVEESDLWYFDGHHLKVTFNEKAEEPEFHYEK